MTDTIRLKNFVDRMWDEAIIPTLIDYIKIPNKSPAYDPDWAAHGHMESVTTMFADWARHRIGGIAGASVDIVRLPERTPLILIDIPGAADDCVLLYGHLDKQPEMTGWTPGYGPWMPRLEGDKLYGRGGADDGYAMFGALTAILALRDQAIPHARCVILIEASEESGSPDLPFYVDHLAARIGTPSLVICLDSGCGNYDQLWLTTSLRGLLGGSLTVRVLDEGVHSGDASGIVPSATRILRQLLSRLEDETTGAILPAAFQVPIPPERLRQAGEAAAALGDEVYVKFPFAAGVRPVSDDLAELVLNRTWRPQLAITGIEGLPPIASAGNVALPYVKAKLSLRLPPRLDGGAATVALQRLLEADPPSGAQVEFDAERGMDGWDAPPLASWLEESVTHASETAFSRKPAFMGEGGSIPFMGMLGEKFPAAQFVVTGVLGPHSNAHGPNEFLHIPTGKRITQVIALVLRDHCARTGR